MPYIPNDTRRGLLSASSQAENPGELNFELTSLLRSYLLRTGLTYHAIADAISALECAKLELYRRIAVPYEERKRAFNGDVYPDDLIVSSRSKD